MYSFIEKFIDVIKEFSDIMNSENMASLMNAMRLLWAIMLIPIWKYIIKPIIRNRKWRKQQICELLKDHAEYTNRRKRRLYIQTRIQKEMSNNEKARNGNCLFESKKDKPIKAIRYFSKKVLTTDYKGTRRFIVLGESGMGKTTFVVNLVWKYIYMYKEKTVPFKARVLYCGDSAIIDEINNISDKGNTILILDALDENMAAIKDFNKFYSELLRIIKPFRYVILTCRTQFFETEDSEPSDTGERGTGADKGYVQFNKFYISLFNNKEVRKYIGKVFCFNLIKQLKSYMIIKKCNELMQRPLLLSYMPDIIKDVRFSVSFNVSISVFGAMIYSIDNGIRISEIYELLIDRWLERESTFVENSVRDEYKRSIYRFSIDFAIHIFNRNMQDMELEAMNSFLNKYVIGKNIDNHFFKERSLIIRDSSGRIKFAHKSFMEFFVAKAMFERGVQEVVMPENYSSHASNMVTVFYDDMCNLIIHRQKKNGAIRILQRLSGLGDPLGSIESVLCVFHPLQFRVGVLNDYMHCYFREVVLHWTAINERIIEYLWEYGTYKIVVIDCDVMSDRLKELLLTKKLESIRFVFISLEDGIMIDKNDKLTRGFLEYANAMNIEIKTEKDEAWLENLYRDFKW